jgi:hypothetical protein
LVRDIAMIATDCPNCGEPVATFAKTCGYCGAPNGARRAGMVVVASLVVLLVAIGVAVFAVVRWQRLPVSTEASEPAASDDFTWLTTAMKDCDTDAANALTTLHFLVIPLTASQDDAAQWRSKSINNVGNALLLPSDDVLKALMGGNLSISKQQYVFSIRDEDTSAVYKWTASSGVKRFSTPDAEKLENFKVQFLTGEQSKSDDWGATFVRRKGNCYWVNAVIKN